MSLANPTCPDLAAAVVEAGRDAGISIKRGGVYLCMEGPQFSTRAESDVYRGWGMDVIGMTNLQEAKLAREAEICYCTMALVTDYDCWHPHHDAVTITDVLDNLKKNSDKAQQIIRRSVQRLPLDRRCQCKDALQYAILTDLKRVPEGTRNRLEPLIRRYL